MTRWRRTQAVAEVVTDRVALLDLDHLDRPPVILEGSGAVIWQLLQGEVDELALVAAVSDHFGVAAEEVAGPVSEFVAQLAESGLVEPA